jgi:hypothetical protein
MSVAIGPYQAFYTGVPTWAGAISLRPFVAKDPSLVRTSAISAKTQVPTCRVLNGLQALCLASRTAKEANAYGSGRAVRQGARLQAGV